MHVSRSRAVVEYTPHPVGNGSVGSLLRSTMSHSIVGKFKRRKTVGSSSINPLTIQSSDSDEFLIEISESLTFV